MKLILYPHQLEKFMDSAFSMITSIDKTRIGDVGKKHERGSKGMKYVDDYNVYQKHISYGNPIFIKKEMGE